nr:phosphotransferase family protein [Gordonia soli]
MSRATDPDVVAARIATRLNLLEDRDWEAASARVLPAGASRTTYAVDLADPNGEKRSVIVRAVPAAEPGAAGLAAEARVLSAAMAAGVPVPAVLDVADSADGADGHDRADFLGFPYVVMDFVDGESIPRKILRDDTFTSARAAFVTQVGDILARIHTIDDDAVGEVPVVDDPVDALGRLFPREYAEMPAGLVLATEWLRAHRPESAHRTVVHGDFRLGNLLVTADGVSAVLDWELVHLGDPVEDLGWLCAKAWRFGADRAVAGMGDRDDLLDAYARAAGWRPSIDTLRWWELYATVRWGLICGFQANRHIDGAESSMELAAVGRRSAEQEFDALLALGIVDPEHVPDPLTAPSTADERPHGPPSRGDLLAAVRGFLTGELSSEALSGSARFHTRVAANVIDIVHRQLLLGDRQTRESALRWRELGVEPDADIVGALRDGALDATDPAVRGAVAADVRDRLVVVNPRHFSMPNP